ncbi:MAG: hypothetical protein HKN29_04200 [Rhodothermales bacterium]|nr:hypothetical protein [Rhodothermales bacterium]
MDTHDPDVRGGSWGFRVLITPGVIALWPLILGSLRRQGGLRPAPYSAPHDGSRSRLPYRVQPSLMALTMLAALALFVMGWLTLGATPGT